MRVILFFFVIINPLSWVVSWYDLKRNAGKFWVVLDLKFKLALIVKNLWAYCRL